jgi:two-component system KDP operon response regulator KdpE
VQSDTPQRRILVVDDEPTLRRICRSSLAALGFDAGEAGSGEQALSLLAGARHDLVLLDIEMPGIGGIETCRRIQHLSPRPAVVILSVRDSERDKAIAFEAGADDYITKPFSMRDLIERIHSVLATQK